MLDRICSRRRFLQTTAVGGTVAAAAGIYRNSQRRVRLGLIGCGARGKQLAATIGWTKFYPLCGEVTALCDVDAGRAAELQQAACPDAAIYADYHRLLERDDLDAVVIAAPDHWHTPLSLAAMRAGKAVYCEKPLTLTVEEGQLLVREAQATRTVFQVGTQQRSDGRFQTACDLVRNGRLGCVRRVVVSLPTGSLPAESYGGPFDVESPPAGLDWNAWLGQAPAVEFCRQRFDPFRWWFEYSGGFMTDWGAHHLDIVHWALGVEHSGPLLVDGRAELPKIANGYNTPRNFNVDLHYSDDVTVHVELSSRVNGIRFEGERGSLFVDRHRIVGAAYDELLARPFTADAVRVANRSRAWGTPNFAHMLDFLHCVETGATPIADVASQHRTATACHLANISMRLGRKITWDPQREQIVGDVEAAALLGRPQRQGYEIA